MVAINILKADSFKELQEVEPMSVNGYHLGEYQHLRRMAAEFME